MSSESASAGSSTTVSFNVDLPGLRIAESNHAAFVALSHCLGLYLIYARAPPKLQSKTSSVNLVYHHVLNALREVLKDANESVTSIEKAIAEWKQCVAESEMEKSLGGDQFASIQQHHWPPVDVVLSSVLEAVAKKYHVEASDYVQFCLRCACVPSVTAKKLADEGGKLESSKIVDFMAKLGAKAGPALTPTQHAALAGGSFFTLAGKLYQEQQNAKKEQRSLDVARALNKSEEQQMQQSAQALFEAAFPSTAWEED